MTNVSIKVAIKMEVFIDPGVNSLGLALFADKECILSKTILTKKGVRPNQAVNMADNVLIELERLVKAAAPSADYELDFVYEEPNLSGRFLSRAQRTMDTLIGALQGLLYYRFQCQTFTPIHPMTLKAFFKAARTDKLDMALKAGQFLPESGQNAMSAAIAAEAFDVTDALALAALYYARQAGKVFEA